MVSNDIDPDTICTVWLKVTFDCKTVLSINYFTPNNFIMVSNKVLQQKAPISHVSNKGFIEYTYNSYLNIDLLKGNNMN